MTEGFGAESGHEPLLLMTAESVGNFICAAARNDCNAKADAGTSCLNPTSLWRQDGGTRSSCFSPSCVAGFSLYVTLQILGVVTIKKKNKPNLLEGVSERGHVNGWDGNHQNSVPCWEYDSGSGGPMEKPRLHSLCVPVHVLVEWQPTNSSTVWF